MYLPPQTAPLCFDSEFLDFLCLAQHAARWMQATFVYLSTALIPLLLGLWHWLLRVSTWANLNALLYNVFSRPSEWPVQAFHGARWLFTNHPHVVHIVSFSIFFGPIVILLPLLLLHELVIGIIFNLSFALHGLLPGTVDDRYLALHSTFDDLKGSIFSSVESYGARYSQITTAFWPLVVVRLASLGLGGLALYSIMSEKQRQVS